MNPQAPSPNKLQGMFFAHFIGQVRNLNHQIPRRVFIRFQFEKRAPYESVYGEYAPQVSRL